MCFLYNVEHGVFVLIIASPAQDHVGGVFICRMDADDGNIRSSGRYYVLPDDSHYTAGL